MKESKVRDEAYLTIQGWMLTKLHLEGTEVPVYAIIFGFSQVEGTFCECSFSYFEDWTGISKRTVIRIINSLVQRGLIIKEQYTVNGVVRNRYRYNQELVKKVLNESDSYCVDESEVDTISSSDKMSHSFVDSGDKLSSGSDKLSSGSDKLTPNNIVNIIVDIINKKNIHRRMYTHVHEVVDVLFFDDEFMYLFRKFYNYTNNCNRVFLDKSMLMSFINDNLSRFETHHIKLRKD